MSAIVGVTAVIGAGLFFLSESSERTERVDTAPTTTTVATTTTSEPTELDVIRTARAAVWRVLVSGCDVEGSGTAWAIDEQHLITNGHVVEIDSHPILRSPGGPIVEATVIGRSMEPDLAVLRVDDALSDHLDWADTKQLEEGQRLIGLGFPVPGIEFATNPGTLVSFQVEAGTRTAIRTDAAVDRGSSGGPMITTDGEVAGVITRMADNDDGFQNVPLAFTADALQAHADQMIAEPDFPEPDCSAAEATIDPRWDWDDWNWDDWDLPEYEPYIPPTMPEYTTTTAPCPSGAPKIEIESVEASHVYEFYDGTNSYDVTVIGRITNEASATIFAGSVYVLIEGDDYETYAATDTWSLRPGESSRFKATSIVFDRQHPPTQATIVEFDWDWDDWDHYGCGTR